MMETTQLPVSLRPYQTRGVDWLARRKRGIVCAPAGSGKTLIAAGALEKVATAVPRDRKVLVGWTCFTIEQRDQALAALERFPRIAELCEVKVECYASGIDWSDRDVLIVDEAHHSPSDQLSKQILACPGARWGFTATPWGDDPDRNKFLSEMFGGECLTISREEVAHNVAPVRIIMHDETDPGLQPLIDDEIEHTFNKRIRWWTLQKKEEWELRAICTWQACITIGIVNNKERNAAAIRLAKDHAADSTIILVNQIEHGKSLAKQIPGAKPCYSKMGSKSRRDTLEAFKAGDLKCLVATSLLEEGADLPRAAVLIVVSGGRSARKAEQTSGRIARIFPGKTHGICHDFSDARVHPCMANHAKRRMQTYRKLGYEISFL